LTPPDRCRLSQRCHNERRISDIRQSTLCISAHETACARPFAQSKLPTIGLLGPASASVMASWTAAFAQRLREFGWIKGRNITIEYRWAEGGVDRVVDLAAELVRLNTTTGTGVPPLKQATSAIFIVFTVANDPVGSDWYRASRGRAATSPAYLNSPPIWVASAVKSCVRSFLACAQGARPQGVRDLPAVSRSGDRISIVFCCGAGVRNWHFCSIVDRKRTSAFWAGRWPEL
jgi:hypothetical protein